MPSRGKCLGVVFAGGQSRRFGAAKAFAPVDGRPLIEHAIERLAAACDGVAVSGMAWQGHPAIADHPGPSMGPLGALNGALLHAAALGFAQVMCCPVDVFPLPANLADLLGEAPAVFDDQHLIGVWPVAVQGRLDAFLARGGRAFHAWIAESGARRVADPPGLININRPQDLARAQALAESQRQPPPPPE